MTVSKEDLRKLQAALENNRRWDPGVAKPQSLPKKARKSKGHEARLRRPKPFDEPGQALGEPLDGVGLGYNGLRPVFLVRQGRFIDITRIEDCLEFNSAEAKYKVVTEEGRFIISKKGTSWLLEKHLDQ
ncbi:MAG: hypothetical protein H0Z38_01175 [Firmicutes bacterium]|nr:hypothetical protein [Bacillota bacterium]